MQDYGLDLKPQCKNKHDLKVNYTTVKSYKGGAMCDICKDSNLH